MDDVFVLKVRSVEFKNQWNNEHGTMYYYDVQFENDDKVYSYGSKKFPQTLLRVGKDLSFKLNVIERGSDKPPFYKIIPFRPDFSPNLETEQSTDTPQPDNEKADSMNKRTALSATVQLIAHGIIPLSDMRIMYNRIINEYL